MLHIDAYLILLPQYLISLTTWLQIVLSMNRFRGMGAFSYTDLWALLLLLLSAHMRWIATVALQVAGLETQVASSTLGSILSWAAFVIVFNSNFSAPSAQQWFALFMSVFVILGWEVQNRMIFTSGTC